MQVVGVEMVYYSIQHPLRLLDCSREFYHVLYILYHSIAHFFCMYRFVAALQGNNSAYWTSSFIHFLFIDSHSLLSGQSHYISLLISTDVPENGSDYVAEYVKYHIQCT